MPSGKEVDVDDAVEVLDELGVAELEFVVELDVTRMVAPVDEGGCTSPVNTRALILLGHSGMNCPVIWGMNSPMTSMKSMTSFEALVHVFTMREEREDTPCLSWRCEEKSHEEWEEEITHVVSTLSWGVCVIVAILVVGVDI